MAITTINPKELAARKESGEACELMVVMAMIESFVEMIEVC